MSEKDCGQPNFGEYSEVPPSTEDDTFYAQESFPQQFNAVDEDELNSNNDIGECVPEDAQLVENDDWNRSEGEL